MSDLISAAKNGYSRPVQNLIESGQSVNVTDKDNATPLYWAACLGHEKICQTLLNARCNVNTQVKWGSTALHAACDRGHANCVKLLIDWRANVDVQNKRGDTPLHLCAYRGFLDIVVILINGCADPLIKNSASKTPLQEALSQGHIQVSSKLQEYTKNIQQFSSLPGSKSSSELMDSTKTSHLTSWPQCCNSTDSSFVPNINNSPLLQNNLIDSIHYQSENRYPENRFPAVISQSRLNHFGCDYGNYGQRIGPQESFDIEPVQNGNVLNRQDMDELDGVSEAVTNGFNGLHYPQMVGGFTKENGVKLPQFPVQQCSGYQPTGSRHPAMMHTNEHEHRHPYPLEKSKSRETIENYAESLQLELVKCHDIIDNVEKEKCELENRCSEMLRAYQIKEKEVQNVKQLLMTERRLRQQQSREHVKSEEQRRTLLSGVVGRSRLENNMTHEHLLKFLTSSCQNISLGDCEKVLQSLQMQIKELWMNFGATVKLDADNEEWIMGKDYELVHDRPINHISEGIRNGSCSLVFQIKRHRKSYILKMMINLINLDFDHHSGGYSLDGYLIRNFGMEYHVPLLLDKHPNIVKVLHHYQGSTEKFLQFHNLLIPPNLDVPIEMARRTTFIVMETFPQSLRSFIITQRTACPEPSFGLPDVFLLNLLYQLLEVLCVLQDNRIVHRDIKGDNIFLDKCLRPVLGDFGFARSLQSRDGGQLQFSEHSQASAGNAHAWAPEVSRFHRITPASLPHSVTLDQVYCKSDIFALGRMFYAFLSPVIDDDSFPQSSVEQPHYDNAEIPELPDVLSAGLRYVLKQMVLDEPNDRPTPRQALLRVGMLIAKPSAEEVISHDNVVPYCQARMLKLLALSPRKSAPENVLTIDQSVAWIQPEIEASFFVNISPQEFWEVLVDLRQANLLDSEPNANIT